MTSITATSLILCQSLFRFPLFIQPQRRLTSPHKTRRYRRQNCPTSNTTVLLLADLISSSLAVSTIRNWYQLVAYMPSSLSSWSLSKTICVTTAVPRQGHSCFFPLSLSFSFLFPLLVLMPRYVLSFLLSTFTLSVHLTIRFLPMYSTLTLLIFASACAEKRSVWVYE